MPTETLHEGGAVRWKGPQCGLLVGVVEELTSTSEGEPAAWVDWQAEDGHPIGYERKQGLPAGFRVAELILERRGL